MLSHPKSMESKLFAMDRQSPRAFQRLSDRAALNNRRQIEDREWYVSHESGLAELPWTATSTSRVRRTLEPKLRETPQPG